MTQPLIGRPLPVVRWMEKAGADGRRWLIHTQYGQVPFAWERTGGDAAVLLLPDVGGDPSSFAGGLGARLTGALDQHDVGVARAGYRERNLDDAIFDALAAIQVMSSAGVRRWVLVGHGLGGTAAVGAAAMVAEVAAVVALAPQSYGLEALDYFGRRGALFIHGTLDDVVPSTCTLWAHELALRAGARSELRLLEGTDHDFKAAASAVQGLIVPFVLAELGLHDAAALTP